MTDSNWWKWHPYRGGPIRCAYTNDKPRDNCYCEPCKWYREALKCSYCLDKGIEYAWGSGPKNRKSK